MIKSFNIKLNIRSLSRCFAIILCTALMLCAVGCNANEPDDSLSKEPSGSIATNSNASSKDSSSLSDPSSNADSSTNVSSDNVSSVADSDNQSGSAPTNPLIGKDIWQAVPMVSQALLDAGFGGGEGCQWPTYIIFDTVNGKLAFLGTDVGGMYRSTDGGKSWSPCTIGFEACGATGMAVDPNNTKRVLAVGCNSYASHKNGLYLSTDSGNTWSQVYSARVGGYRDYRQQIAFDESSYDKSIGGSKIVYWSREEISFGAANAEVDPALYKSTDGGKTWKELPNSSDLGHSIISVHPTKGWVYCANSRGLFRSKNGGQSFEKIQGDNILSMDTVRTKANNIYLLKKDGLYLSTNSGDSFKKMSQWGYPTTNPNFLRVSPADPNRMVLQDNHNDLAGSYGDASASFYSHDGGKTWKRVDKFLGKPYRWPGGTWIPHCAKQNPFTWHPTDKNVVLTTGGDFVMRSSDGGVTFKWSNTGYTGMMTGGMINWNVNHPEWLFNPSQDYNGGYTIDGGKTWTYLSWKKYNDWGGWTYGGYVIDEKTVVCGLKDGLNNFGNGSDKHYIAVTYDGGKTNTVFTDKVISGHSVAMGVKGDDNIVFMGEWRTTDKGKTWNKMSGCDGVFTLDYQSGTLFGFKGQNVVKSTDKGETWSSVGSAGKNPLDIAYNHITDELFVVADRVLYKRKLNGSDSFSQVDYGSSNIRSVCVDPQNPNIIYTASADNIHQNTKAVMRSTDGGKSWKTLTRTVGDGRSGPDGAKEATTIRVNPATREVFVGTCCRGMWKMAPPE